jgi:hypothetical protein
VRETVSVAQAVTTKEAVLPGCVREALGELVGAAKEGLLALSVATGLGVLAELLETRSTRSSARSTRATRTAPRCATATRPARSPWVAAVLRSGAREPGPLTASARCRWPAMRTSPIATR